MQIKAKQNYFRVSLMKFDVNLSQFVPKPETIEKIYSIQFGMDKPIDHYNK